jgi:hypothetical protein
MPWKPYGANSIGINLEKRNFALPVQLQRLQYVVIAQKSTS